MNCSFCEDFVRFDVFLIGYKLVVSGILCNFA